VASNDALTVLRNVRIGNRLVDDVGICVLASQLVKIGVEELEVRVPIELRPNFAEEA